MEIYEEGLEGTMGVFDDVAREKQINTTLKEVSEKIRALRARLSRLEEEKNNAEASRQTWKKQFALLAEKLEELCGEEASNIIEKVENFGEHYYKDLLRDMGQLPVEQPQPRSRRNADGNIGRSEDEYYKDVLVSIDKYTDKLKLKKEFDDFNEEYRQDNILASIHPHRRRTA